MRSTSTLCRGMSMTRVIVIQMYERVHKPNKKGHKDWGYPRALKIHNNQQN